MPLTLVTGPANAAKAGYVLDRLREVLPREPFLVVPTSADVAHYERELVSGGVVFGAQVLTFSRLVRELGRVTGLTARPLGPVARERVVRAAIADARLRVLAPSAAAPGFAAATGRAVRGAAAVAGRARALHARAALVGRRALRRRAGRALLGLPLAARGARPPGPRGRGVGGARRAARRPGGMGAAAGDLLRLRRADARAARRGRDARAGAPRPTSGSRSPTSRGATRWRAARRRCRSSRRWPTWSSCRSAPSTTPARRGRRCTTSSAGCSSRSRSRRAPNGAVRLLEAGGERAEAEIVGAEVLELMREGVAPEDIAVLVRGIGDRRPVRAGAGRLRDPGRVVAARAARPHAARRGRAGGRAGGAAGRARGGPADVAADARDGRGRHRRRRRARRAGPPRRGRRRARGGREVGAVGGAAGSTRWPPPRRPAARRCSTCSWPRRRRSGRPRTPAAPTCSAPRSATRRGWPPSCAARPPSCGRSTRRCSATRRSCSRRSARSRCARAARATACCSPTRWRSGRGASARCSCAGCRTASSPAGRCPSRSSTTRRGGR